MTPRPTGPSRFVAAGDFGVGDVRWEISREDQPNEVAAAVLHHLLLRRLRQLHAGRLTAAGLKAATGGSNRTSLRLLNGESDASLADLVAWTAAAGPALLDDLTIDLLSLLPAQAPPLVPDWQTGQWCPPRFSVAAGPLGINWGRVATRIADYLSAEEAHGRVRLMTFEVIRHMTITAMTEAGVTAGLLSIDAQLEDGGDGGDAFDLIVDAEPETAAILFACPLTVGADRGALRSATGSVIATLRKAALAPADRRTVVVVAREAVVDRLARLWRGCTGDPGDPVILNFGVTRNYVEAGAEPFDVRGRLLARSANTPFFVTVAELGKPDMPTAPAAPT